jgi:nucleotide-binding universal stress UspA family protein
MNAPLPETTAPTDALCLKTVLVAVDLSPHSEATARYAIGFAKPFGASVVLVHVQAPLEVNGLAGNTGYEALEHQRQQAQGALSRLAGKLRAAHPACQDAFLTGDPAEQIARLAQERDADLIITASHHPGFLARLLYLDQAPRIMHAASCPVLVYHEAKDALAAEPGGGAEGEVPRRKILLPVDLAGDTGPTVAYAAALARRWDAELYALHVYCPPPSAAHPHQVYAAEVIDWQRRQLEGKLLDWVSQLQQQSTRAFALFDDGESPAREIQRVAAKLRADLIVISTHDRAWLAKYLFYSDADEIARGATAPVLVFRAKQETERPGR